MSHCAKVLRETILMAACMNLGCREPKADSTPTDPVARRSLSVNTAPLTSVRRVRAGELCFRSGALRVAEARGWLSLEPKLRVTAMNSAGQQAAIVFRYLGATPSRQPGAQQEIGLELLSSDACNLVSTTWRVDERSLVLAAVKTNRDFTRLEQCRDRGSRSLRAFWQTPVERPIVGTAHELSATIRQGLLEVRIDEQPVLRAVIAGQDPPTSGSSGLRSDNVNFELVRFEADVLEATRRGPGSCP